MRETDVDTPEKSNLYHYAPSLGGDFLIGGVVITILGTLRLLFMTQFNLQSSLVILSTVPIPNLLLGMLLVSLPLWLLACSWLVFAIRAHRYEFVPLWLPKSLLIASIWIMPAPLLPIGGIVLIAWTAAPAAVAFWNSRKRASIPLRVRYRLAQITIRSPGHLLFLVFCLLLVLVSFGVQLEVFITWYGFISPFHALKLATWVPLVLAAAFTKLILNIDFSLDARQPTTHRQDRIRTSSKLLVVFVVLITALSPASFPVVQLASPGHRAIGYYLGTLRDSVVIFNPSTRKVETELQPGSTTTGSLVAFTECLPKPEWKVYPWGALFTIGLGEVPGTLLFYTFDWMDTSAVAAADRLLSLETPYDTASIVKFSCPTG